jgi:hypothetical protein
VAVEYPFLEARVSLTFGNCIVHSPFIVAIRATTPTDSEVLEVLRLSHYRASELRDRSFRKQVFITNAGEWTLVADDWHYTIWHADNVWDAAGDRGVTRACGRWGSVFAFWVGDSDESYGFDLFADGQHQRSLLVESPSYTDRKVRRDEGMPLPGETAELCEKDAMTIVWTIAQTLGISVDPQTTVFRRYALIE